VKGKIELDGSCNSGFNPVEFDGVRKQWQDVVKGSFEKVRELEGVVG
jgi:hypothetical protein